MCAIRMRPVQSDHKQVVMCSQPFCLFSYLQRSITLTYISVWAVLKNLRQYLSVWATDKMGIVTVVQAQSAVGTKSGIFKLTRLWSGTGRGNATRLPFCARRHIEFWNAATSYRENKNNVSNPHRLTLINLRHMTRDGWICEMYGIN